jgi:5-epi-alpha-selinene synthase
MLFCPFSAPVNPNTQTVGSATVVWAERQGLLTEAHVRSGLSNAQVGALVGRLNPTAPLEPLQLLADWCTWLFLQDDRFDEQRVGKDPDLVAAHYGRSLEVLSGAPLQGEDSAYVRALAGLSARFRARARAGWMRRFLRAVENCFEASVWEARNRAQGIIPALDAYRYYRSYTGGVFTLAEATELTENLGVPFELYDHPSLQKMLRCAVNVICWANDIVSLEKELRQGDVHNLVIVLRQEFGGSMQEAMQRAATMHNDEVRRYLDMEAEMPDFGAYDALVRHYVTLQKAWMKGNLEWSYMSERYYLPRLTG